MKRITKYLFCLCLVALVTASCRSQPQEDDENKWEPLPHIKAQAWPSQLYNQSQSGQKFIYFSHPMYASETVGSTDVGTFRLVDDNLFPKQNSREFRRLARDLDAFLNKDHHGYHINVSVAVSENRKELRVSHDHLNMYYPSEKILKVLSATYKAEFLNVHMYYKRQDQYYWSGPWLIAFDPRRHVKSGGESYWVAHSELDKPFSSDLFQGKSKSGEEYLSISFSRHDGFEDTGILSPRQKIEIVLGKDGKPVLKTLKWSLGNEADLEARLHQDWFGQELAKYVVDLPPEMKRFLTPEILAQIQASSVPASTPRFK